MSIHIICSAKLLLLGGGGFVPEDIQEDEKKDEGISRLKISI